MKLRLNQQTMEWERLPKGSREEGSIYMDGMLHNSFSFAKGVMKKKNKDLVVCCSGYPGSGKSKIISQVASFCDPTFTEDRMHQTTEEFIEAVKAETGVMKSHVLDEAWEGLSSQQVRREIGRALLNIMNVIRQKRLFIFLVLPDFFDLSKSIAIFRSRWLIHCYEEEFGDVGKFLAFDQDSKKKLYVYGKKFEDYNAAPADFYGVFTKADSPLFNWDRYENEIKPRAMQVTFEKRIEDSKVIQQRNILIFTLATKHSYTTAEIADSIDVSLRTVQTVIKKMKDYEPKPSP